MTSSFSGRALCTLILDYDLSAWHPRRMFGTCLHGRDMIVKSVSHRSRAVDSHRALTVIFEESRCVVYHAMQPARVLENCTIAVYNVKRGLRPRNVPTTIPFPDKRCGYHEQIMLLKSYPLSLILML
jgi:hypothetical protein